MVKLIFTYLLLVRIPVKKKKRLIKGKVDLYLPVIMSKPACMTLIWTFTKVSGAVLRLL